MIELAVDRGAAAAVAEMKQTRRPPPDPSDFDAFYEWVME